MKGFFTIIAAFCLTVTAGCSNKFESIPDDELADMSYECRTVTDQSPGMAIKCDNVTRECKNRREQGRYVC